MRRISALEATIYQHLRPPRRRGSTVFREEASHFSFRRSSVRPFYEEDLPRNLPRPTVSIIDMQPRRTMHITCIAAGGPSNKKSQRIKERVNKARTSEAGGMSGQSLQLTSGKPGVTPPPNSVHDLRGNTKIWVDDSSRLWGVSSSISAETHRITPRTTAPKPAPPSNCGLC